jgi:type II secretory pathway component HofQ
MTKTKTAKKASRTSTNPARTTRVEASLPRDRAHKEAGERIAKAIEAGKVSTAPATDVTFTAPALGQNIQTLIAALKLKAITLTRQEDTKNYAKFTFANKSSGAFGSVYLPLAKSEGLKELFVIGSRE